MKSLDLPLPPPSLSLSLIDEVTKSIGITGVSAFILEEVFIDFPEMAWYDWCLVI